MGSRSIDALALAALLSIAAVSLVAIVDLTVDGELSPALLALFVAIVSPLVPALLIKYGGPPRNGNGKK